MRSRRQARRAHEAITGGRTFNRELDEMRAQVAAARQTVEDYKATALGVMEEVRDSIRFIADEVEAGRAGSTNAEIAAWTRTIDFKGRAHEESS